MQSKLPPLLLILVWIWFAAPEPARACSCNMQSTEAHFQQAAAVFWGIVLDDAGGSEYTPQPYQDYLIRFQVQQAFKGVSPGELVLHTRYGYGMGDCSGGPFEQGNEYVVFASTNKDGTLGASLSACGATSWGRPDRTDPFWTNTAIQSDDWIAFPLTLLLLGILRRVYLRRVPPRA
jgi:hypothetical protein